MQACWVPNQKHSRLFELDAAGRVLEVAGESLVSLAGDSSLTGSGSTICRSFSGDSLRVTMALFGREEEPWRMMPAWPVLISDDPWPLRRSSWWKGPWREKSTMEKICTAVGRADNGDLVWVVELAMDNATMMARARARARRWMMELCDLGRREGGMDVFLNGSCWC